MKNRSRLLLLVTVAALAVVLAMALGEKPSRPVDDPRRAEVTSDLEDASSQTASGRREPRGASSARREASPPKPSRLARSLRGTDVDGALVVDDAGNFVATADALAMFEYFFTALGEADEDAILARIRQEIDARLDPPADAQAVAFLERYLAYRERGRALTAPDPMHGDLRAALNRLRDLRREVFGEEVAERLFGESEAVAEASIRQREIATNPNLSSEEKAAAVARLEAELPEPIREQRRQVLAATRLREDEARVRAEGGGEQEIRQLRVERFGDEAADRLEALDREQADWQARVDDLREEGRRINEDDSLSQEEKRIALDVAIAERFDERERLRVEANLRSEVDPETPRP